MDGLIPVNCVHFCIIFLAAIVHSSLQLGLGSLLLLYHASLGKHIKKRTRQLVSNFILGTSLLTCLILSTISFLIFTFANSTLSVEALSIVVVIMFVLAILCWFFYYRRGRTTELWLPKTVARYINNRAKVTESNTEAFSLGMLTTFAEMPFSCVLMIVAGNSVLALPFVWQFAAILLYTFISVLPLFILKLSIKKGSTVVDVQKWRTKNKNFFRFLSGFLFITLAIFILAFRIMGVK